VAGSRLIEAPLRQVKPNSAKNREYRIGIERGRVNGGFPIPRFQANMNRPPLSRQNQISIRQLADIETSIRIFAVGDLNSRLPFSHRLLGRGVKEENAARSGDPVSPGSRGVSHVTCPIAASSDMTVTRK